MFEKDYATIFESEDELDINTFKEDFYAIFNHNKIKVQLIKPNRNNSQLQNDFMGVRSNENDNDVSLIDVCIQSFSPQKKALNEEGYSSRGELIFTCYTLAEVDISSKYKIKFLGNHNIQNIKPDQEFRIATKDFGLWKGQYGFKSFEIIAI